MSAYIDFATLKEKVTVEAVATWLNLEFKASGNQLRGPCPACNQGGQRVLVVTPSKGAWYCFAAQTGGDCIKLASHILNLGQREAAERIAEHFLQSPAREPAQRPGPRQEEQEGLQALSYLDHAHAAVEAVGFDLDVAKALGIGFAGKGMMRGTVAIPVRLEDGTLAGYIGVTEARLPKTFHLERRVVPFQPKKSA